MDEKEYSVSEAVRLIGVESHVLRYWEEELQIEIRRNAQGHRLYSEENIETFRCVRALKEKGLQLKAIRLLMDRQGEPDLDYFAWKETNKNDEGPETVFCEIVPTDRQDSLFQFEQILRRLMEEVVSEQNEKLEDAIIERMKEELEDLYLQYCQITQEAAVSIEKKQKWTQKLGHMLKNLLRR